jgi:hypothetical protein
VHLLARFRLPTMPHYPRAGAGAELDQLAPAGQQFKHPGGDYDGSCTDCHNGGP